MSWTRATVVENERLSPGLHRLSLSVTRDVAQAFLRPGQYHRIRVSSGEEAFFAMASEPGVSPFEYLVRASGGAAESLVVLGTGASLEVSQPEGPGFPLHQAQSRPVLLIGTGTGFAPLWSALQSISRRRADYGPVHALYGVDTADQLAFAHRFEPLRHENINIVPVLRAPPQSWRGASGRIQDSLQRLPISGAVAFLCGHSDMVSEATEILVSLGIQRNQVFLNLGD